MKIETASAYGCWLTDAEADDAGARVWVPREKLPDLRRAAGHQGGFAWWCGVLLSSGDIAELAASMETPTRPATIRAFRSSPCWCGAQIQPGQTLHQRDGRWVCGGCAG